VSHQTIVLTTRATGKSALDEFLPEWLFVSAQGNPEEPVSHLQIPPGEIRLDPVETLGQRAQGNGSVQLWPMVSAACVALGASLVALAVFARLGLP
jgi:hypothetical protein